jgi:hypothetical protein
MTEPPTPSAEVRVALQDAWHATRARQEHLSRDDYLVTFRKRVLVTALKQLRAGKALPNLEVGEVVEAAVVEWRRDVGDEIAYMQEAQFAAAWLRLAEMHVESLDGAECARWIRTTARTCLEKDDELLLGELRAELTRLLKVEDLLSRATAAAAATEAPPIESRTDGGAAAESTANSDEEEAQTVVVVDIPEGAEAGSQFTVVAPGGQQVTLTVPQDAVAGQQLEVMVQGPQSALAQATSEPRRVLPSITEFDRISLAWRVGFAKGPMAGCSPQAERRGRRRVSCRALLRAGRSLQGSTPFTSPSAAPQPAAASFEHLATLPAASEPPVVMTVPASAPMPASPTPPVVPEPFVPPVPPAPPAPVATPAPPLSARADVPDAAAPIATVTAGASAAASAPQTARSHVGGPRRRPRRSFYPKHMVEASVNIAPTEGIDKHRWESIEGLRAAAIPHAPLPIRPTPRWVEASPAATTRHPLPLSAGVKQQPAVFADSELPSPRRRIRGRRGESKAPSNLPKWIGAQPSAARPVRLPPPPPPPPERAGPRGSIYPYEADHNSPRRLQRREAAADQHRRHELREQRERVLEHDYRSSRVGGSPERMRERERERDIPCSGSLSPRDVLARAREEVNGPGWSQRLMDVQGGQGHGGRRARPPPAAPNWSSGSSPTSTSTKGVWSTSQNGRLERGRWNLRPGY